MSKIKNDLHSLPNYLLIYPSLISNTLGGLGQDFSER